MSVSRVAVAAVALVSTLSPLGVEAEGVGPAPPLVERDLEAPRVPVLRIAWMDVADAAPGLSSIALAETKAIFSRMGLDVVWRRASVDEIARPGEVRVILLKTGSVDRVHRRHNLGATPVSPSDVPHVWIHVPSIRAVLGLPQRPSPDLMPTHARQTLGLALGRVVAHEVVHAVTPSLPHGRGLMSALLTRRQLTTDRVVVELDVTLAVQAALRGSPAPGSAEVGLLAATGARQEVDP